MIAADRQTFVVHLRPEKGVTDPIKALRATLKNALRAHGLRCVTIATTGDAAVETSTAKPWRPYLDYLTALGERRSEPAPDVADQSYWDQRRQLEDAKAKTLRGDR